MKNITLAIDEVVLEHQRSERHPEDCFSRSAIPHGKRAALEVGARNVLGLKLVQADR